VSILYRIAHFFGRQTNFETELRRGFISLFEETPNARYLDCGCNLGKVTLMAAEKIGTKKVIGIDVQDEIKNEVEAKGIEYYHGDLNQRLPFEDGSFDVVSANQVIEHLSNTDTFIKEIHRVLSDGGYAIISTPNLASTHSILLLLLGWQPPAANVSDEAPRAGMGYAVPQKTESPITWPLHRRIFTLRALEKLFEYHSFKVEKSIGSVFFPFPASLARFACRMDKRHSAYIAVKVRKAFGQRRTIC